MDGSNHKGFYLRLCASFTVLLWAAASASAAGTVVTVLCPILQAIEEVLVTIASALVTVMFVTVGEQAPLAAATVPAFEASRALGEISTEDDTPGRIECAFGSEVRPPFPGPGKAGNTVYYGHLPVDVPVPASPPLTTANATDRLAAELGVRSENERDSIVSGGGN